MKIKTSKYILTASLLLGHNSLCLADDGGIVFPEIEDQEKLVLSTVQIWPEIQSPLLIPTTIPHTTILPEEDPLSQPTITETLQNHAGIAANGQGGHLQNYSIRGISGQRISTLVSGMRIITDRRAGTNAAFLDPLLIDGLTVYRGAVSTYFGSGAFGGAIDITPKKFHQLEISGGYQTAGNGHFQQLGWGNGDTSLGIVRRQEGNSRSPDGQELNTRFTQYTGIVSHGWKSDDFAFDLLAIPSLAKNIGKSNTDFPDKTTHYPSDKHILAKFSLESLKNDWRSDFALHINRLKTEVNNKDKTLSTVENTSYDFSAKLMKDWRFNDISAQSGFEYFGRHGVESIEQNTNLLTHAVQTQTTLNDGSENELSFFNMLETPIGPGELRAGMRYSYFFQSHPGAQTIDKHFWSGNLGYQLPIGQHFEIAWSAGSSYRMPSLSERFFSGTTGRGKVIGNHDLDPEYTYDIDVGISNFSERHHLSLHSFYKHVDGFIDRLEIEDGVFTFVNVNSGRIYGAELEGEVNITDDMLLAGNITWMRGIDNNGNNLNDISPHQMFLEYRYTPGDWRLNLRLRSILEKNRIGPNEKKTPSANLLSASVGYRINKQTSISVTGGNLFNESYFNSADRKATFEPGRYLGIQLEFSM